MADFYAAGPAPLSDEPGGKGRRLSRLANFAGAAASLALLVGVGVWGTKIILRDVSGIPVVMAAEGPMRVAPERPGGELADHQGLAVNAVAGLGVAEKPADTLHLAPGETDLSDEDVTLSEMKPVQASAAMPATTEPLPSLSELTDDAASPEDAIQALADQLVAGTEPLLETGIEPGPEEAGDEGIEIATISPDIPGVAVSRRPATRPVDLAVLRAVAAQSRPKETGTREISAGDLAKGTRLVQLGAFDSADTARSEWTRLEGRFRDYMEGHARVIEKAESGGSTFYRLRAHGFETLSDARRFCATFVAENADCIPVVVR
ncbi:sporulation protein [Roseivivax halodurans JCM 10272]|uniref:Sporulation protein n=1 Tax=Roseivivax halodurans JCM 10272 TaxID=1449350 RepID=X7EFG5_9RHOB|nr:SPOR domain-containing protein [Roseivivax halodurans]ETX14620.1 sporulation protein [Roseivivax halodurans JCM 10272]